MMNWGRHRRLQRISFPPAILGLVLAILLCAPVTNLALVLETHSYQAGSELPSLCAKTFGPKELSTGMDLEPGLPGLAAPVPDGPVPVAAWTPGMPSPAPAWSVRAPPSIA